MKDKENSQEAISVRDSRNLDESSGREEEQRMDNSGGTQKRAITGCGNWVDVKVVKHSQGQLPDY